MKKSSRSLENNCKGVGTGRSAPNHCSENLRQKLYEDLNEEGGTQEGGREGGLTAPA